LQLGFVIDHSKCIGCHACTVACKSENDVPLGDFRTWVKYTEVGTFPEVRRSFAVLRCNQCTDAPCIDICPVTALEKRADGIVDIDPEVCIGCKACTQGCPYDAIYLNDNTGTAEKCHFCAHRTEQGLAPACAVVCPTEAIIPGDFHDTKSVVSKLKAGGDLAARKTEAGTGPNVFYKEAAPAGLDPLAGNRSGGYLWAQTQAGVQMDAQAFEAAEAKARGESGARTVYDVAHPPLWGGKITGYLFTKSIAAGVFLAALPLMAPGNDPPVALARAVPILAMLFLGVTSLLLVTDLKRPERFLTILTRPNWNSWLAKGSFVLMGYGMLLTPWLVFGLMGEQPIGLLGWLLTLVTAVAAIFSAIYTAWLFGQAKGRVLWMKRGLALHLFVQALIAGSATLLLLGGLSGWPESTNGTLADVLVGALAAHLLITLLEGRLAPKGREPEYKRVARLVSHGPFATRHWIVGVGLGVFLPAGLLMLSPGAGWTVAALLALVGLYVEEDVLVRAGQAGPIS
jgi:Fe-S-cluster-containing dehydrogenase component/formate-dependent nitrite reductase membrane component NrfD